MFLKCHKRKKTEKIRGVYCINSTSLSLNSIRGEHHFRLLGGESFAKQSRILSRLLEIKKRATAGGSGEAGPDRTHTPS